jgi:carbonic anhydrase/acetyltransferase-like protein (isoleucine patch superfamily)
VIVSSGTKKPKIHSSAYVAPTATISGDVTIGADCAVLHGAVVVAEGAPVTIGKETVIMENAVLKASGGSVLQFPLNVGERCIVGPHAYVVGATVGNGCFVGAGTRVANGTKLADGTSLPAQAKQFFQDVFNVEGGKDAASQAAQNYARFLRKAHAQDKVLDEHRTVAGPPRRSGEEPPPTQATEVDKVVDVMMLELEEMEHRRQEAIKRQKGK